MKSADTLTTLFRHNLWANVGILERCAELTNEQLDTSMSGAFGTIRDTLQHFVSSEQSYLYRIRTGQPLQRPEGEAPMTIAEMLESARASGAGLIEWAPKVRADDTVQVEWDDGTIREVPKAFYLTQVINHATEHRAQIMAIITQLGLQAPDLDTWTYLEAL